jgi:hypothetical protein
MITSWRKDILVQEMETKPLRDVSEGEPFRTTSAFLTRWRSSLFFQA